MWYAADAAHTHTDFSAICWPRKDIHVTINTRKPTFIQKLISVPQIPPSPYIVMISTHSLSVAAASNCTGVGKREKKH